MAGETRAEKRAAKKAAKQARKNATNPSEMGRIRQIRESYKLTKRTDPKVGLFILLAFVVGAVLGGGLFYVLPGGGTIGTLLTISGAITFGVMAALIVFGRRAQKSAYAQMEGQPGAAAAALRMLRRGWKNDPAIAVNKHQDVLHRVVGPPGIVLVGEGNQNRMRQMIASERRKHERIAADVPIHEVFCGNGEGQVPLGKLARHINKLGRNIKGGEMNDIVNRLKALDAHRSAIPMPKGPVPTSMKGMRGQMRGNPGRGR